VEAPEKKRNMEGRSISSRTRTRAFSGKRWGGDESREKLSPGGDGGPGGGLASSPFEEPYGRVGLLRGH